MGAMKPKVLALTIVITTVLIIGLLNFAFNRSTQIESLEVAKPLEARVEDEPKASSKQRKIVSQSHGYVRSPGKNEERADNGQGIKEEDTSGLSPEDVKLIKGVAALSDAELKKEAQTLQDLIEKEDLFELLEEGELSKEKEAYAKGVLEKFALLGLEQTRRRYMAAEPELKDAIYAHRESLKEIRELLSDEED